ncbi:MAG: glycine cleavage system aminomethyltransferase GcvT [Pseudomonadota bacterium]
MGNKTVLHAIHVAANGKMVDFGGWDMPLHYGSQLDEHHLVRRAAGMFDVSHMTIVDISGDDGEPRRFLKHLLANDIDKAAKPGQAVYTCMLNADGGVVDDLIAYWMGDNDYRLVVNAATRAKDLAWMAQIAKDFTVTLAERSGLAMIAVQGPLARERAVGVLPGALQDAAMALKPFHATFDDAWFVARTGYTGEDGWELMMPAAVAGDCWQRLQEAGIAPAGLGARDTLRLEAGLNLYGSDMDETTSPLESNLGWTVDRTSQRGFVGEAALDASEPTRKLVGLVLMGRGVLRDHQIVHAQDGDAIGEITSGGFSPTLNRSVALARVSADIGPRAEVSVRNKRLPVQVVKPPFVRRGKVLVALDDA